MVRKLSSSSNNNNSHDFEVKTMPRTEDDERLTTEHTAMMYDNEKGVVKSPQKESQEKVMLSTISPKAVYVVIALAVLAIAGYGSYILLNQRGIVLKPVDASENAHYMPEGVSMAELALHNTPEDCWLEIHGNVYDLTDYASSHPGGASLITDLAGSQATVNYDFFHDEKLLETIPHTFVGRYLVDSSSTTSASSDAADKESESATTGSTTSDTSDVGSDTGLSITSGSDSTVSPMTAAPSTTTTMIDNNCYVQQYTLQDLQSNYLWMAFYGQVYNLDGYVHPGGSKYIEQGAGTDATDFYETKHKESLLTDSKKGVQSYWIGELADVSGMRQVQC